MGVESSVANKKGKGSFELEKGKNLASNPNPKPNPNQKPSTTTTANTISKGKKSRRRHQKKATMVVQKLYDTCKEVFAFGGPGVVPSPENLGKLRAILDNFQPADVGLNPEMPYFRMTPAPTIRYLHLYENEKFSMGIFCLPPSGVIPLHNHPGMTVFSKLLFGTMHIKSYDWVTDVPSNTSAASNSSEAKQPDVRLAKVKVDSDFTAPCNTSILYPADGGNMHCFTAVTACAVLDVLGPPYSDVDGRHCAYYLDFPFTNFRADGMSIPEEEREGYAWLQEIEKPEDLAALGAKYTGPKFVE